jgi:putative ABC transport system substrate-binding protein
VAFERRLRELGQVDGKNLVVDFAFAEGKLERLAPLARELVARKPDVLFVSGPEAPLKALSEASDSIPIVVCALGFDPQVKGYVKSLARPGSNITGVHLQQIEATGKRLELLHDLLPAARRIAVLSDVFTGDQLEAARGAGQHLKLELQVVQLRDYPYDYASALKQARSARSEAMLVLASPRFQPGRESLVAEARKLKLPTVFYATQFVEAGGLASFGASVDAMFVRAANYVDKIIKGEAPASLPMEQPTEFDLALNFKLAKEFGIKIPQVVLVRVTQRIE